LEDHHTDPTLLAEVEQRKKELTTHYSTYYAGKVLNTKSKPHVSQSQSSSVASSPEKVNFTARYSVRQPGGIRDELAEYYRQPVQPWDCCDPLKWWGARQDQFLNLSQLARDIMTIPGVLYSDLYLSEY